VIVAAGGVVIVHRRSALGAPRPAGGGSAGGLSTEALVSPVAVMKPVGVQRHLKEAQGGTAQ
jgi:hypothetical protein